MKQRKKNASYRKAGQQSAHGLSSLLDISASSSKVLLMFWSSAMLLPQNAATYAKNQKEYEGRCGRMRRETTHLG
jgi:hypothetical protein